VPERPRHSLIGSDETLRLGRQDFIERQALGADENDARLTERRSERREAGKPFSFRAARHLDGNDTTTVTDDVVHLAVTFAPIEELSSARVVQVRADCGLDKPSPQTCVATGFTE
jgi:hypothetical protein